MKILLVKPETGLAGRVGLGADVVPDIGLGYLVAALRRERLNARIWDANLERFPERTLSRELAQGGYNLVGIKTYTVNIRASRKYLRIIRRINPTAITVVGGPHPSSDPEHVLDDIPEADFAFRGEAETGFPRLALLAKEFRAPSKIPASELKKIPGLIWRDNGVIATNAPSRPEDLDALGMPAWDEVHPEKYNRDYWWLGGHYLPLITTRGCPFHCSYCGAWNVVGRKLRFRSPALVVDEMEWLIKNYGFRRFNIADDNFSFKRDHAAAFCEEILSRKLKITWDCATNGIRFDTLDAELLKIMEQSGCRALSVAVESGSDRILKDMHRQTMVADILHYVNLIRRHTKMLINSYYILGYPTESRADILATIKLSHRLPVDAASFFLYAPHPGTEVEKHRSLRPSEKTRDWDSCKYNRVSQPPPGMSARELKFWHAFANWSFYLRPQGIKGLMKFLHSPYEVLHFFRRIAISTLGI